MTECGEVGRWQAKRWNRGSFPKSRSKCQGTSTPVVNPRRPNAADPRCQLERNGLFQASRPDIVCRESFSITRKSTFRGTTAVIVSLFRSTFASLILLVTALAVHSVSAAARAEDKQPADDRYPKNQWVQLFNGRDLDGWTPKIRYCDAGDNHHNTFRVEDGLLKVRYDSAGYPEFGERFGHLFFRDQFRNYRFRVEYRFVGNQCKGGPGWAIRNSGVMVHGQAPATMTKDQDFPVSIEVQLLGGNGKDARTTSNLCTPGTNVVMNRELKLQHCINSTSPTFHGEQWVTAEIEVHNNEIIRHLIDGEVVLEYSQPQLDKRDANARPLIQNDDLMLHFGSISLQSESHPIDFRKVEIMVLE